MRKILILLLFLNNAGVFCQKVDYSKFEGEKISISKENSIELPFFNIYERNDGKPFKIEKKVISTDIHTPENLMAAYYSSNSISEVSNLVYKDFKTIYKPKVYAIAPNDTSKNYIELIHKLTFKWIGYETAIIKFKVFKDSVLISVNAVEMRHDNGWYLVSDNSLDMINETLRCVKSDFFKEVSYINYKDVNSEIINYVVDKEKVQNISKIYELIIKYRKANNIERLKEFCDVVN